MEKNNLNEVIKFMDEVNAGELSYDYEIESARGNKYHLYVSIDGVNQKKEIKEAKDFISAQDYHETRQKLESLICDGKSCETEDDCNDCDELKSFNDIMADLDRLFWGKTLGEIEGEEHPGDLLIDQKCDTQEESY